MTTFERAFILKNVGFEEQQESWSIKEHRT